MSEPKEKFEPRPPDYYIKVKMHRSQNASKSARLGSAWVNPNGTVSLQLNPGTVLDWRLSQDAFIILVPRDDEKDNDVKP